MELLKETWKENDWLGRTMLVVIAATILFGIGHSFWSLL